MEGKTLKLIEIASLIQEKNPECALSGSLALQMQGVKIRREPKDIDIYLPYLISFNEPDGFKQIDIEEHEKYENEDFDLFRYEYQGVKIDIFMPERKEVAAPTILPAKIRHISKLDIIAFKMQHALDRESYSRYKHKDDIIHIMVNN